MMNPADYMIEQIFGMYRNRDFALPPIAAPADYGLAGFKEVRVPWGNKESVHLWQRFIDADRPTYVVYHGTNGHWGHVLPPEDNKDRDPRFRVQWLQAFPEDANLIAVSMPGFGASTGTPSRTSFDEANKAVLHHLLTTLRIEPTDVIAAGESLGANHALNLAAQANEQGTPLFQVTAVAPFRDIAAAAADVVDFGGWVSLENRRNMAASLFGSSSHHHDNLKEIDRLKGSGTQLVIISGGRDKVCRPWHQRVLMARAIAADLPVALQFQDDAAHTDWDSGAIIAGSRAMRSAMSEHEGISKVWEAGQNARKPVKVPALPAGEAEARGGRDEARGR